MSLFIVHWHPPTPLIFKSAETLHWPDSHYYTIYDSIMIMAVCSHLFSSLSGQQVDDLLIQNKFTQTGTATFHGNINKHGYVVLMT